MKKALLIILAATLAKTSLAQPAGIEISFAGAVVSVSGVKPGHDVLVLSIAREPGRYQATVTRRQRILSATGGPTLTWDTGNAIPLKSVWCALDLQNGEFDVATPSGFELRRMADAPLFSRDKGDLVALSHERAGTFILVATPGRGVWLVQSGDGGSDDEDSRQGKAGIHFDRMPPLTGIGQSAPDVPAPKKLTANDVVILIDSIYLDIWSGRVGREVLP